MGQSPVLVSPGLASLALERGELEQVV